MKQQRQNNGNFNKLRKGEEESFLLRLIDRFNSWRLSITLDVESVLKVGLIAILLVLFALLQTTFFARFRPFGAVPDLMLPFVIAVGTLEKERIGAVTALFAAFFIDAAGGSEIMLLPLLYVPAAYAVGILTVHRFRDCFAVAATYTAVTSVLRGVITLVIVLVTVHGISLRDAMFDAVIPEFFANLVIAAFPQLVTRAVLRPFHKTRAERTQRF